MDLSAILPLLMNTGNSGIGGNDRIASVLSAMGGGGNNATKPGGADGSQNDTTTLLSALMGANPSGDNNTANIMNILSLANKNRSKPRASGLKPIKDIVPNDILGIMVKRLNS